MGLRTSVSRGGWMIKLALLEDQSFVIMLQVGEKTYEATKIGHVFYFNGQAYFGPHEN